MTVILSEFKLLMMIWAWICLRFVNVVDFEIRLRKKFLSHVNVADTMALFNIEGK